MLAGSYLIFASIEKGGARQISVACRYRWESPRDVKLKRVEAQAWPLQNKVRRAQ
jgi:hypothetical protein